MKFILNKKGDASLVIIIIFLVIGIIWFLTALNSRECNSNKDCTDEQYCGSDFACHQIPIIERTIVKRSLTLPILIICATIVALAIIWRWEKLFGKKENNEEIETTETESPETYYSSQFQYSAK